MTPNENPELFEDLRDRSRDHSPITRPEREARVERLARILRDAHVDALLVEPTPSLAYLSGVTWGMSERLFALVVTADGEAFWIAPAFEVPRAQERVDEHGPDGPVVPWDEQEYAWKPLAAELASRSIERIAIDPRARAFVVQSLAEELGAQRVVSGVSIVRSLRGRKDSHEIELLRAANELTKQAIVAVSERLRPGTTDHEVGAMMRAAQERLGLTGIWVLPLIGEGAAYPHGAPEGRVLEKGDPILVDTGGALHGYQSDITRTWIFDGAPSKDVLAGWNAVRAAQVRAFETLRPGVPCRAVDRAAREVIEQAGFGAGYASFAHRLGHGIGLEGHEEPNLDGGNETLLAQGMTFSNEPGVYLPGRFGIRLEDIVLVTEDGADVFGTWQRGPGSPA